jgi:hypothetical protein
MQLNLNVDYKDIVTIVKQLPVSELKKLNTAISHEIVSKKHPKRTNLQTLILKAPTWTDSQYNDYLSTREHINKSRLV